MKRIKEWLLKAKKRRTLNKLRRSRTKIIRSLWSMLMEERIRLTKKHSRHEDFEKEYRPIADYIHRQIVEYNIQLQVINKSLIEL